MNKLLLVLLYLMITSCGSNAVNKPTLLLNAENYSNDAMQAYAEENWARAQGLFNRALMLNQSIDDRLGTLTTHINLVEVTLALHDNLAANKHLNLAADIVKTESLKNYQPRITLLTALIAKQQAQSDKAIHFLDTLLPRFTGELCLTPPDNLQLAAITTRTEIAFQQMQSESLWTLRFNSALKQSASPKDTILAARLLRFQSALLIQQGHYAKAELGLQQALIIYKERISRSGIAGTLMEIGTVYQKQSDWQTASNYFKRSITVYHSLGNREKVDRVTKMLTNVEQLKH